MKEKAGESWRGCVRESWGKLEKAGESWRKLEKARRRKEDEVMARSQPAVSSASGLEVATCIFPYLFVYFRFDITGLLALLCEQCSSGEVVQFHF